MAMYNEERVLCVSNSYEQKYYFNPKFDRIPDGIKDELKIMCVLFTEDIGGILVLEYDEEGTLFFRTEADEGDLLYDEIGSGLKIRQLQREKQELLESLELFYRVVILGQSME